MSANNSPFSPELRTLSIVPRWSIVFTTQRDTVANHSYFVAVYAHMIARVIKWKGPRDYLMFLALCHDMDETVTGDMVSPVKSHILDNEKYDEYVDSRMHSRMGGMVNELADLSHNLPIKILDEADLIVKAADRLDALFFLIMELRRGNKVIEKLVHDAERKLEGAWRELPADEAHINFTWQTVVLPAIQAHQTEGGMGV